MSLRFSQVSKSFSGSSRTLAAINGIDVEIRDGEFFVILGPSGCGKSTFLNLAAGLERPTSGEIWMGERLVAAPAKKIYLSPRERNVAMVFQSYALYPHMTVSQNISFPLEMAGENPALRERAVKEAARRLAISHLLDVRPAELSGGQRQRVAIARAIVRKPSLFLLDEPLSNLDARLRASTRQEIKDLQRSLGVTTLYVTHDQEEAGALADRVALLREGQIEQIGTPKELKEHPSTDFTKEFFRSAL